MEMEAKTKKKRRGEDVDEGEDGDRGEDGK